MQECAEERTVYVHVVATRVRKLYRCQVVIVRDSLTAPPDPGPVLAVWLIRPRKLGT